MKKHLSLLAVSLLLAACAGPAKNVKLYRLSPQPPAATAMPEVVTPRVIAVLKPKAPAALDTSRIALTRCATDFDYFAGMEWVDTAPALVHRLAIESLDGEGGRVAMDAGDTATRPDVRIQLDLRTFQAEYCPERPEPDAVIRIGIRKIDPATQAVVAARTFEARHRASANNQKAIIAAFNAAMREVLDEIKTFAAATP